MKAYPYMHKHPTSGQTTISEGMTLRDYFAAKALQRLLTSDDIDVSYATAVLCYRMADAMMKAREVSE
jgi:hypothetical protein